MGGRRGNGLLVKSLIGELEMLDNILGLVEINARSMGIFQTQKGTKKKNGALLPLSDTPASQGVCRTPEKSNNTPRVVNLMKKGAGEALERDSGENIRSGVPILYPWLGCKQCFIELRLERRGRC